jgi:uncharacterized protein with HEPN domain
MEDRATFRLQDIIEAIDQINALLDRKSQSDLESDKVAKAAFERFLEILSEAARHIPADMKAKRPDIAWRRIADIGNHLRHAYHRVDSDLLWEIHAGGDLVTLREAVVGLLNESS